jgi:hypothetical protein
MAAKEALTFQDKEKEMLSDVWLEAQVHIKEVQTLNHLTQHLMSIMKKL